MTNEVTCSSITEHHRYSRWISDQSFEDYSLGYTSKDARNYSAFGVAGVALGSVSFLALESIGASLCVFFGMNNFLMAMLVCIPLIFILSYPITYQAAKNHIDIDLLSRAGGFGYLGSSVTSLVYASFSFIFFAFEATILANLMYLITGLPLALGYLISAFSVIPLLIKGFSFIGRFQNFTFPFWVMLQALAFGALYHLVSKTDSEKSIFFTSQNIDPLMLGVCISVLLSLVAQVGEQADYLRFMPKHKGKLFNLSVAVSGPGWVIFGALKIMFGALLGVIMFRSGLGYEISTDPNNMYLYVFSTISNSKPLIVFLTAAFVVLSQVKINVTNGYAGSLAWSNFFARITHSHPGRVFWVIFNITIACFLMFCDIYKISTTILSIYAVLAVSWCATLSADFLVNRPLGLAPKKVEFKRSNLYDVNPVGCIAMSSGIILGLLCFCGLLGPVCASYSALIALVVSFIVSPVIAFITHGKYYLLEQNEFSHHAHVCSVCGIRYEKEDICYCPKTGKYICSLCCTLNSRCNDFCRKQGSIRHQILRAIPRSIKQRISPLVLHFLGLISLFTLVNSMIVLIMYRANFMFLLSVEALMPPLKVIWCVMEILTLIFSAMFLLVDNGRRVVTRELENQNHTLKTQISKRILIEKKLQESKKLADSANLAKSRYLSGLSHELRTPLNSLLGYAQILYKADDVPQKHRKALNIITRSGEYLSSLIEELLDISKIEAGRFELHQNNVRIRLIVEDMVSYFKSEAERRGLYFKYTEVTPLPQMVKTDEKRIHQILNNLLSNALKYTTEGGIEFRVSYRSDVADFEVTDTGIGISENDLCRIFNPFIRLENAKNIASGSGLGLTITNLLVTMMGGDISVKSTLGKGTSFRLKLMLSRVDNASSDNLIREVIGYKAPYDKKFEIMSVDDNENHRALIYDTLTPLGFKVTEASGAIMALEKILDHTPDLFLVDISMPEHDGWYLVNALRGRGISAPIVMLSAEASEGKAPPPAKGKYNAYLIKPLNQYQLFDTFSRLLPITYIYKDESQKDSALESLSKPHEQDSSAQIKKIRTYSPEDIKSLRTRLALYCEIGFIKGIESAVEDLHRAGAVSDENASLLIDFASEYKFENIKTMLNK